MDSAVVLDPGKVRANVQERDSCQSQKKTWLGYFHTRFPLMAFFKTKLAPKALREMHNKFEAKTASIRMVLLGPRSVI